MAKVVPYTGNPSDFGQMGEESWKREQELMRRMIAESDAVDLSGPSIVGLIIQFPVADGSAVYQVIKDKPFTVEHIPYCDGYRADSITLSGLNRKNAIEREARGRMFSAKYKAAKRG